MAIRIGCGSWSDQEYVGVLYPPGLASADRLKEYGKWFNHVEINSSYYAVPKRTVVENWLKQTPPHFSFDLKLHRNILSSVAKVKKSEEDQKDLLAYTLEQIEPLLAAKRLGTFLLLLPGHFRPEKNQLEELDALIERIQPYSLAVELRHREWVEGKNSTSTVAYFRERGLVWVGVDMPQIKDNSILPALDEVTQPKLAYLRLHGRNTNYLAAKSAEERHNFLYDERELKEIVKRIKKLSGQAENVHVVANNHAHDYAPRTAFALKRLLGEKERIVDWIKT